MKHVHIYSKMDENNQSELKKFICINCMNPSSSLYTTYSRDVIRITECKNCCSTVDKYVEYDIALVVIDLILQYKEAYRHVLINLEFKSFSRVIFIFLLCHAYTAWIEGRQADGQTSGVFDLEWKFYESLLRSAIEFMAYSFFLCLFLKVGRFKLPDVPSTIRGNRFLIGTALIGFYGDLFVVFSIIWRLHGQRLYKLLTQSFILISHLQVQRALFPAYGFQNVLVVLGSVCVQLLSGYAIDSLFVTRF